MWHKNIKYNTVNVTQYTSAQSFFFLSKATCFEQKSVIFRTLQHFPLPDALPTLGSHIVYNCGINLSYNFLKKKVFISFIKCVIYRLCLKFKIFLKKFFIFEFHF